MTQSKAKNSQENANNNDGRANNGCLYVVATPIGNLDDISYRAAKLLAEVDIVLAEDTRHTAKLLQHLAIDRKTYSYHMHNENNVTDKYIELLRIGKTIALVSDAGTPLLSDPGFPLVRAAQQNKIKVSPVPGASAMVAALSVAGMPLDRFAFEGFLAAKKSARLQQLGSLAHESRTMVFYESSHRIAACLADMSVVFGGDRAAVVARELTKTFEQVEAASLSELVVWLNASGNHTKGEFVVLVAGNAEREADQAEARKLLAILLPSLSVKKAANATASFCGGTRNKMYDLALDVKAELKGQK